MINDEELNLPPILLIYDGHGSHTTLSWIDHAHANNMILYCLPPHTTHRLQPLDVGCFGPLQIAWFNRCDEILDETGEGMAMKDVVKEYFVARKKSFTKKNISQAWRKSGLNPLNPTLFTPSDFAPSHRSSTNVYAPSSFPRMPHVPDLPGSDDSMFDPAQFEVDDDGSSFHSDTESDTDHSSTSDNDLQSLAGSVVSDHIDEDKDSGTVHENPVACDTESMNSEDEEEQIETPTVAQVGHSRFNHATQSSTPSNPVSSSPPHLTRSKSTMLLTPVPQDDPYKIIRKLERENQHLRAQRDSAEMHAVFSSRESAVWKYRFNHKKKKLPEVTHVASIQRLVLLRMTKGSRKQHERWRDERKRKEKKLLRKHRKRLKKEMI